MSDFNVIREFHCDNWGKYDQIPTTTLDPKTHQPMSREAIQALTDKVEPPKDSFKSSLPTHLVNPESAENIKKATKTETKATAETVEKNAKEGVKSILAWAKKHKGATAGITAIVALLIGGGVHYYNENKDNFQKQDK